MIGTEGHNVVKVVREAMDAWSHETGRSVEWVEKGQNLLTEMYSALCAEVPVNRKTAFDFDLLNSVSGCFSGFRFYICFRVILSGRIVYCKFVLLIVNNLDSSSSNNQISSLYAVKP